MEKQQHRKWRSCHMRPEMNLHKYMTLWGEDRIIRNSCSNYIIKSKRVRKCVQNITCIQQLLTCNSCNRFRFLQPGDLMGELCYLAKSFVIAGAYPERVFNVGWVGLVCVGMWAVDGWAWLVFRVAQSVTHYFNSTKDGISSVFPQLRHLVR